EEVISAVVRTNCPNCVICDCTWWLASCASLTCFFTDSRACWRCGVGLIPRSEKTSNSALSTSSSLLVLLSSFSRLSESSWTRGVDGVLSLMRFYPGSSIAPDLRPCQYLTPVGCYHQ